VPRDIESLLTELGRGGVRYLVVGGVAVVLHGYLRATADLDLVLDLDPENLDRAIDLMDRLGFRPRAPVPLRAFGDDAERKRWVTEKNLQVFSLWHPKMPGFEVDLFVESPFDFAEVYSRAIRASVGSENVPVVAVDDLIAMKRRAGRPKDQEDVDALLALRRTHD
jgi:hypothetical protein